MHFDGGYDPYKAAYGSMPSHAAANPGIKQLFIDGHFCYAYKFGIVTNGLGIVRSISFYNQDFFDKHPDLLPTPFSTPIPFWGMLPLTPRSFIKSFFLR